MAGGKQTSSPRRTGPASRIHSIDNFDVHAIARDRETDQRSPCGHGGPMRTQLITAAAVFLLSAAGATAQTSPAPVPQNEQSQQHAQASATPPSLAGTWKSAANELKLTSDFDKSVWGPNATSVRTVELTVRPNNEATLRVVKKVIDGKGRTVAASTWIEEAELQIGAMTPGTATRLEHQVNVVKAVRLFPDDPNYKW